MIDPQRIEALNDDPLSPGRYVLYWMQASQRERYNHALEYAISQANRLRLPVVVAFGLSEDYPEANERSYAFMLEGLAQTRSDLANRGIQMVIRRGSPETVALGLAGNAAMVVADRGYLSLQVAWRAAVARDAGRRVVQVESEVVVPVGAASNKQEFAARTLRPKIHRQLERFCVPLRRIPLRADSLDLRLGGLDLRDVEGLLGRLRIDRSVKRVVGFRGGAGEADRLLRAFIAKKLAEYHVRRNEPAAGIQSDMSPYLHFGQVSPVEIALKIRHCGAPQEAKDAYLEELIVRRELSMNFVTFNSKYDSYERSIPPWARATLAYHARDKRSPTYSLAQLEAAQTDDPYWNAAQREMLATGKMHNYMRMYWGKKILQWCRRPDEAFRVALYLNNKYELDGRDPNSYAGVAWCFGKHDRPWAERRIFGKVRYMNAAGLERKFDMDAYRRKVDTAG